MTISNTSGTGITVFTGNTVGISNIAPSTTLSVGGTISAIGNVLTSNYGTCPPLTYRQGLAGSSSWVSPGAALTTFNFPLSTGSVNMQCGTAATKGGKATVTFPLSYSASPLVLLTAIGPGNSNIWITPAPAEYEFSVVANTLVQTFSLLSLGI
jgi:hypothetical protein